MPFHLKTNCDKKNILKSFMNFNIIPYMPIFRVVVESQIVILQPRGCFPLQEIKAIWLSKKKQSVTFYEVILVVTNIMII